MEASEGLRPRLLCIGGGAKRGVSSSIPGAKTRGGREGRREKFRKRRRGCVRAFRHRETLTKRAEIEAMREGGEIVH